MPTPDTTIARVSEPSSAPPEFILQELPSFVQQQYLGVSSGSSIADETRMGENMYVYMTPASSEPLMFFCEGSNFDPMYAMRSSYGGLGYQTTLMSAHTSIIKSAFLIQEWELSQQYGELKKTLKDLVALEEEDDWKIEESVYAAASYYATELRSGSVPAPQVSVHGPKSVVFNWSNGFYNLYLTISANRVSALLSSPERIIQRKEYSKNELTSPLALLYSGFENPINSASHLSESFR
ncbi:MAG: hypothetical protein JO170_17675 [Verrucomicrobia bacterium]|nr:hypothetical protein [Verrucomicrobiota bacterium]